MVLLNVIEGFQDSELKCNTSSSLSEYVISDILPGVLSKSFNLDESSFRTKLCFLGYQLISVILVVKSVQVKLHGQRLENGR